MKKASGDTVKTNAMRQLEVAGISYRTASYEYDESNLSGLHAAEQVGIPAEQVFKTLGSSTTVRMNVFSLSYLSLLMGDIN